MPDESDVNSTFDPSGEIDGPLIVVVARNCSIVYCREGRHQPRQRNDAGTNAGALIKPTTRQKTGNGSWSRSSEVYLPMFPAQAVTQEARTREAFLASVDVSRLSVGMPLV